MRSCMDFTASWIVRQWDRVLVLILLAAFVVCTPWVADQIPSHIQPVHPLFPKVFPVAVPSPALLPKRTGSVDPVTFLSAEGVVVYDVASAVTIYEKNADELLSPASTTKILTALVALDTYNLDDVVTVKTVANNGQVMGLVPGEQMTVENLLYGALVLSGNDAAWALGEQYQGGVDAFVAAMNKKAQDLHLTNSHFTNPVGYDDPEHKMTARDLARLSAFALTNKTIAKIVAIPQITVSDVSHTRFHPLSNVNQLLGKVPGVAGIKTGWTEEAGENLVTLIERNGHRVILVVLKSKDRFGDTMALINWVFSDVTWETVAPTP